MGILEIMNGKLHADGQKRWRRFMQTALFVLASQMLMASLAEAQTFYILTQGNRLSTINMETCDKTFITTINTPNTLTDIAFTPDGKLWGVNGQGQVYEIVPANGNTSFEGLVNEGNPDFITSLVGGEDGLLYSAGGGGNIYAFNPEDGTGIYLGNAGYGASGDLTFANGQLVMAAYGNQMVTVDLENPSNSTPLLSFSTSSPVFGVVTIVEGCDESYTYASSSDDVGRIYAINFETETLTLTCQANERIYGAASELEFRAASPMHIDTIYTQPSVCSGANGSIIIAASSGNGGLAYSLNNTDFQDSYTFTNLAPGPYTVYVRDSLGCMAEADVELPASGVPELTLEAAPTRCGAANGAITAFVEDGQPPYSYSLNGQAAQGTPDFDDLASGNYTLQVEDAQGCTAVENITVAGSSPLQLQVEAVPCGEGQSILRIDAAGGSGAGVQYQLDESAPQSPSVFEGLDPGSYAVSATDSDGCTAEVQASIPEAIALQVALEMLQPCGPGQSAFTATALGGAAPIRYQLNDEPPKSFARFEGLSAGEYTLQAVDANGCTSAPLQVGIPEVSPLAVTATATQPDRCANQDGQAEINASGGTPPYQYALGTQGQPTGLFTQLSAGPVTATVVDSNGCIARDSLTIPALCPIYIPTAFSPNGDGRNDRFAISSGLPFQIGAYRIYNRWGGLVYEVEDFSSLDIQRFWDGQYASRLANAGLYVYQIEVINATGERQLLHGEVMLVR
ncbi:MAG: T9SS type B sorting domain-containing protein [Bacteroidetes bacterium]|nr:T9SS type B sorting domain-containing protein [Bacteroidota bacterium]